MKNLVIIGTGGFARELYWHAHCSVGYGTEFMFKCFIEGDVPVDKERNILLPGPFAGTVLDYDIDEDDIFAMSITDVYAKERIANLIKLKGGDFITLIHQTALVSSQATLGEGVVLSPFTFVSCNVNVGDFTTLNVYSSIGHDAVIGSYSCIMGHVDITGNVHVGTHTFWGSGSRALPHATIGSFATIGSGSVVLKKVKDNQIVFGIPAMSI